LQRLYILGRYGAIEVVLLLTVVVVMMMMMYDVYRSTVVHQSAGATSCSGCVAVVVTYKRLSHEFKAKVSMAVIISVNDRCLL